MDRILAYIAQIKNIRPHPNADRLELANINHWQVVVEKGIFFENQYIYFFEIDSLIPRKSFSEFLFKNKNNLITLDSIDYYQVRSMELRGELSQGLVIALPDEPLDFEKMGVKKFEKTWDNKDILGKRPHWIHSPFLERIQNIDVLPFEDGCYISEKIDGEIFVAYWNKETQKFGVCSNNVELAFYSHNPLVNYFLANHRIATALRSFNDKTTVFFGEYFEGEVYFFNARDLYNNFLGLNIFYNYDLKVVPQLGFDIRQDISFWMNFADGFSQIKRGARREGIVLQSLDYKQSIKVISNEYLLRGK